MKKWAISICGALISANACAAFVDGDKMAFGVEGLFVRPTTPEFIYATTTVGNNFLLADVDRDHDWAGHLDATYFMAGNAPDFHLAWTHLDIEDSDNVSAFTTARNASTGTIDAAIGRTDDNLDEVDLVAGKDFTFKNCYHFHPFAGVRYVNFEEDDSAVYTLSGTEVTSGVIENEFDGFGLRFGMDTRVDIAENIQFVADAASSIVMGEHQYKNSRTVTAPLHVHHDELASIPEMDGRLGLRYNHAFNESYKLGLEAGYHATHYFDLVDKTDEIRSSGNSDRDDWGYNGAYLRLDLEIA